MTLYLFKFSNYYNRIIKKPYSNVNSYGTPLAVYYNVNFNPNDGLNTEQIINYNNDIEPDYLVCTEDTNIIVTSRWFIVSSHRTRSQQFSLSLYRDVIADWYDEVIKAPLFVEKGMAQIGDPAIFNNETMVFNQIKTEEKLIKDYTNIPWIVGYIDRNYVPSEKITIPGESAPTVNYELTNLSDYEYYDYTTNDFNVITDNIRYRLNTYSGSTGWVFGWDTTGKYATPLNPSLATGIGNDTDYVYRRNQNAHGFFALFAGEDFENFYNFYDDNSNYSWNYNIASYFDDINTTTEKDLFLAENNKIIKVGTNYFRINITQNNNKYLLRDIPQNGSGLDLAMNNARDILKSFDYIDTATSIKGNPYEIEVEVSVYKLSLNPVTINNAETQITQERTHLIDAPYDMFCIPYGNVYINGTTSNDLISDEYGLKITQQLIIDATSQNLYDVQLLPFCPLRGVEIGINPLNGRRFIDIPEERYTINKVLEGEQLRTAIIWCDNSAFSLTIGEGIYNQLPTDNIEFKIENETKLYRLTSPNYSGGFDFSATKNNGINGWRIDCAYKPYNPYIRVAPLFGGLYGNVIDDARGLICAGDFSLPQITDQWKLYEVNNKTYAQSFDRQIQNIEVNNAIQRELEKWNVATGTIQAGVTGAMGGNMIGGGIGAMVGGAVATGSSLAGGLADIYYNEKLRAEAIDLTKDQFGYSLRNIQALPASLTKVSAFNPNNRIFPVLEVYTCTDVEKEALRNKIKYNGMTIMRIGKIEDFLELDPIYIKGKLIRLETINEDFHIVNAIAEELNKGVFI